MFILRFIEWYEAWSRILYKLHDIVDAISPINGCGEETGEGYKCMKFRDVTIVLQRISYHYTKSIIPNSYNKFVRILLKISLGLCKTKHGQQLPNLAHLSSHSVHYWFYGACTPTNIIRLIQCLHYLTSGRGTIEGVHGWCFVLAKFSHIET